MSDYVIATIDALPWWIGLPFGLGCYILLVAIGLGLIVTIDSAWRYAERHREIEQLTRDTLPRRRYVHTKPRRRRHA